MKSRHAIAAVAVAAGGLALWAWRSQLFTVARPGETPRAIEVVAPERRAAVRLDVVLPAVPAGMRRLRDREGGLLFHYWAPWEQHGRAQAAALDSLSRLDELRPLRVVLVCFDPFPSVARFVARQRLRLPVLLDGRHDLRRALPCPSIPYTYVLDASGRIAVAQPGEVDWLAPETIARLRAIAGAAERWEPSL
jgi:hypothetical protein